MTPAQHTRFYFPNWLGTCRRLGWRLADGRLQVEEARLNQHAQRVLAAGTARAAAEHRAPVLDDLRHGVHAVALGRDKSSKQLTNRELDCVVAFMQLMIQETNIGADILLDHPEISERKALKAGIENLKVPEAVIYDICRRSFAPVYSHPHWDQLPLPNLRALIGILKAEKEKYMQEFVL